MIVFLFVRFGLTFFSPFLQRVDKKHFTYF